MKLKSRLGETLNDTGTSMKTETSTDTGTETETGTGTEAAVDLQLTCVELS